MSYTKLCTIFSKGESLENTELTVAGWARTIRTSKALGFIELNDGSCFKNLQIVFTDEKLSNFTEISKQNVGASFIIKGKIVLTPDAKQPLELLASEISVMGTSTPDYPLQKKRHSPEFLREIAHLRPRTNLFSAVFRLRSEAAFAVHKFFNERNFVYAHTPIITANDGEGAGEMFRITTLDPTKTQLTEDGKADFSKDYFGKLAGLTVTGQLEGEAMMMGLRDIYTFGPTFRAEKSNTTKHVAEFWMIEPELAFADLDDVIILAEDMIKYIIRFVMEKCPDEMAFFNSFVEKGLIERLEAVLSSGFDRISYTDAIVELEKVKDRFENDVYWGCDLQTEHERYLSEEIFKGPVFVTDYPKDIKAFYMKINDDDKTVAATDLLIPAVGELIGCSQREDNYDVLKEIMIKRGMDVEEYSWYLDLRKYGSVTHSGFGIGFERLLMFLTGVQNIRDVIPFPRTAGSVEF